MSESTPTSRRRGGSGGSRGSGVPGGRRAASGRRTGGSRGVDLLVGLGVLLPTLVAGAVVLIGDERDPVAGGTGPTTAPLTAATVVCPSGLTSAAAAVRVVRAPGVDGGALSARTAPLGDGDAALGEASDLDVPAGPVVTAPAAAGPLVLDGEGAAAPGIVAGRGDRTALPECRGPSYDEWLVGLGASARYASVLEIVNPDRGEAVVDVELHGATGTLEEPSLRGIQVPGGGVRRIALARVAPRVELTAARVSVLRGRASVSVRTTRDLLGRTVPSTDYLPADTPGLDRLILGVPARPTQATLLLANPGDDEIRVTPRLVTADAVFTPAGTTPVTVPPRSVASVELASVLRGDAAEGVVGLRLESSGAVAASMRVVTAQGDLALLAPAPLVRRATAMVVPTGAKSLVLGGLTRSGTVQVKALGADGTALDDRRVELGRDRTAVVPLPSGAVGVAVDSSVGRVAGALVVATTGRRGGLAVVRLREPELRARIPAVQPR